MINEYFSQFPRIAYTANNNIDYDYSNLNDSDFLDKVFENILPINSKKIQKINNYLNTYSLLINFLNNFTCQKLHE